MVHEFANNIPYPQVYERLQIRITDRGESFYQERMVKLVKELNDAGLLEEDDGRKVGNVYH